MKIPAITTLFVIGAMSAAAQQLTTEEVARECPPSAARVYLLSAGTVTLNGKPVAPGEVARAIQALSPRPTEVCYSRENSGAAPHPNVRGVLTEVMTTQLQVTLYKDGTFTRALMVKRK